MKLAPDIRYTAADFSDCEHYRYTLERKWGEASDPSFAAFIGLNPSTATADEDDPTVRRCQNYARAWGMAGMVMLNLFAFRATDPRVMKAHPAPVGPRNDQALAYVASQANVVVCAWGTHGVHMDRERAVLDLLRHHRLMCLRVTKDGHPSHPLYLPAHLTPIEYPRGCP